MKAFITALLLLLLFQPALAKCIPGSKDIKADLHWSDNSVTAGPDCSASIEVRADPKGEAAATVYLRGQGLSDIQLPFNVFRDGTLHWERTGKRVAFQDARSYGVYRLWLIDVEPKAANVPRTMLSEEALGRAVESRLGRNQQVARFWPDLTAWLPDSALVTVKIQTLIGSSGPLTEHCFGFLVSTVRKNVITAISDLDMKGKYKASCQQNER